MSDARLLRIYRIIYQVLRLFTGKLKEEIAELEKESNEPVNQSENTPDHS